LIKASSRPRYPLEELDVQLQAVTGLRLLIALPPLAVRLVLLICGEARHAVPRQDAMHRRHRDLDAMEPMQVRRDPAGAEVIVLAQIEDFADDVTRCGPRRTPRCPRPIAPPAVPVLGAPPFPFVE
jgi:hypothetical protein